MTQRASSVDNRHGSAEHGTPGTPRERESRRRDRSTADANRISDPVQQAGAFRIMPAGPAEAESMQDAHEKVINRLLAVETSLRKHAQLIGAQGEAMANKYRQQAEVIPTDTKRCEWLHEHIANTVTDFERKFNDHNDKLNVHGLQREKAGTEVSTGRRYSRESKEHGGTIFSGSKFFKYCKYTTAFSASYVQHGYTHQATG